MGSGSEAAERALIDSAYSAAPVGLGILDLDLRFVRANRALAELNGCPIEDHLGRTLSEVNPDLAGEVEPRLRRVIETGEPLLDVEIARERSDGSGEGGVWLMSHFPVAGPAGVLVGVGVVAQDVTERRRAEAWLKDEKAVSEATIESMPALFFVFDEEGRLVRWNRNLEIVSGRWADALASAHPLDLFRRDDRERGARMIEEVLSTGFASMDADLIGLDGTAHPYHFSGRLLSHKDRRFVVQVAVDIEERLRTEAALVESRERLHTVIESQPECVKVVAGDGTIVDMNPAGLAMIEADHLDEVRGKSILGLVAPEYREAYQELGERTLRGERGTLEFEIVGLKGTRRWLETRTVPMRGPTGEPLILGLTRDVTERRRAGEALIAAEARYRQLVEQGPAIVYVHDLHEAPALITYISPKVEEFLGYPLSTWEENPRFWSTIVHPDDRDRLVQEDIRAIERMADLEIEYRFIRHDGKVVWVRDSSAVVRDQSGMPLSRQGAFIDVTPAKMA